ncbi:MAG: GntR family transcriptional regulator [bacterium]
MQFLVNPSDGLPIYRQIMRQVMDAIAGGRLRSGDRMLSHRELSEQLVIAPLTVKKAYDELEALGYIESYRGRGTFVAAHFPKTKQAAVNAQLHESAQALLTQAYLTGLRLPDVLRIVREADQSLTNGPTPRRKENT